jgi:hypothetical protein
MYKDSLSLLHSNVPYFVILLYLIGFRIKTEKHMSENLCQNIPQLD